MPGGPGANDSVLPCAGLIAGQASTWSLYGDNPSDTTQPFVSSRNPAAKAR